MDQQEMVLMGRDRKDRKFEGGDDGCEGIARPALAGACVGGRHWARALGVDAESRSDSK